MMNLFSKSPKFTGNYPNNSYSTNTVVDYTPADKGNSDTIREQTMQFLAEARNAWSGLWQTIVNFFQSYQWKEILFGIKVAVLILCILMFLIIIFILLKSIVLNSLAKPVGDVKNIVFNKKKTAKKWAKIEKKLKSGVETNYKLAILDADNFFDEIIKAVGYEREKSLSNIIEIKIARKLKNNIIEDSGFTLTQEQAADSLNAYKKGLEELGVL